MFNELSIKRPNALIGFRIVSAIFETKEPAKKDFGLD